MKNAKRLFALFLSLILIITVFPMGVSAKSKALSKPSSLSFYSTVSTVTLRWKNVSSASGYTVYKYNSISKKYSALKNVSVNNYKTTKLNAGVTYVYAVKAFKTVNGKKLYSSYSSKLYTTTLPSKVKGLNIKARNASSASLSWTKVKNANGYKIEYSTDKSFKNSVKSIKSTTNTKTISGLTSKNTYFRIYSYKKLSGKTYYSSASSSVKSEGFSLSDVSFINTSKKYQKIEGFGASAAWWGHEVGSWENAEDIIKYLYDKKDGIGLNIYRYNVGTGSRSDEELYSYWARTDGFIEDVDFVKKKITYDFSKDAEAQNSLRIAKKFAGNDLKLTLFSNSPPVQLTQNGKAYCTYSEDNWADWGRLSNLEKKNFSLFAQFECDVADYFVSQGYNVLDISPVNEPVYAWAEWKNGDGSFSMGQEGCHYTPSEVRDLYKEMALKADGKSYDVTMFEASAAEGIRDNGDETDFTKYFKELCSTYFNRNNIKTISTHSYWADAKAKKQCREYVDSVNPNINIACTEYCQMYNDENTGVFETCKHLEGEALNGYTIDFGVQMARVINEDLTILNATQWNWWTGCSNGIYPDGLVYINRNNHSNIKLTKRLWCLGNYSRFIKSGARRVYVKENQSDLISSAFLNPDGSLTVVYVNQTQNDKTVKIDAQDYSKIKVYETSESKDLKLVKSGDFKFKNAVSLSSQSVVSVILTK